MTKASYRQTGSIHIIIVSAAIAILIGALGFIFWQNFMNKDTDKKQESTTKTQTEPAKEETATREESKDTNEGYLVLSDWGVKFKIPDTLSTIKYYEVALEPNNQGAETYYEFTTQRVEDLGGQCVGPTSNGGPIRLAALGRSQVKRDDYVSSAPANNNEPIKGYYYSASAAQSICADQKTDIQQQDRSAIYQMLLNPIAL